MIQYILKPYITVSCLTVQTFLQYIVKFFTKRLATNLHTYRAAHCGPYRNVLTVPNRTESPCRIPSHHIASHYIASYASCNIVQYIRVVIKLHRTLLNVSKRSLPYQIIHANAYRAVRRVRCDSVRCLWRDTVRYRTVSRM